jgi:CheY-like chemotaxis protein
VAASLTGQDKDAPEQPPLRILLVEDDEISRLSARLTLERMGHRVVTANDGAEALKALHDSAYDCVLMDVQMDVMDGVEATRRIRTGAPGVLNPHVPIIAMTAYAMAGDRERFLEAGMDDYVPKPVKVEELNRALGRVVKKPASPRVG